MATLGMSLACPARADEDKARNLITHRCDKLEAELIKTGENLKPSTKPEDVPRMEAALAETNKAIDRLTDCNLTSKHMLEELELDRYRKLNNKAKPAPK